MTITAQARWATEATGFPYEPLLVSGAQVAALSQKFADEGAVVIGPPALEPAVHAALAAEARTQRRVAAWDLSSNWGEPGEVPQDTVRAHLGPYAREFVAAGATRALLQAVTGHVVIPGWSATCLTFYDRAGMHLGPHRDKEDACQYALLVYLESGWPVGSEPSAGLQLHIRDADDEGVALRVTAHANRVIVLHGARLTHFRPPLADGESMTMLNGCYAVVG